MGLPSALLEQPQVWESIYNRAAREYETRLKSGNWTPTSDGGQGELMREVVTGALEQLAIQIGLDVARDLERWVRFHFLCQEARTEKGIPAGGSCTPTTRNLGFSEF
jgi:hypothetical protein